MKPERDPFPLRPAGTPWIGPSPWAALLGAAQLQVCDLDDPAGPTLDVALAVVSDEEAARADRFVQPLHRARFLRGRAFLRRSLSAVLECSPAAVQIVAGADGKPRLAGPGPQFNLSHSGPLAVLALHDQYPLGLDVELAGPEGSLGDDLAMLSEAVLLAPERAALWMLPVQPKRRRFLEFWTAKEARMKMTGEGLGLDPLRIALRLDPAGRPVGYRWPGLPAARLSMIDLRALTRHDAVCALCLGSA